MDSLTQQVAHYLDDNSIGVFDESGATGDIFIATMPDKPDEAIAIYPTGGYKAEGTRLSRAGLPTVTILVRGDRDPRTAEDRAQLIYDLLEGFHADSFVSGGYYIIDCRGIQSGPNHIGQDENLRHRYSLNFLLTTK